MAEQPDGKPAGLDALPETVEIRPAHRFDTAALEAMLAEKLGARMTGIKQMRGGQSNPTFVLDTDQGEFVLRKQPPGKLLPSAHAVDREYRVLSALGATDVPVPKMYFFCAEPEVVGTPFYVMERMRGRVFWSPTLPNVPKEERRAIYFGLMEALAKLDLVDYRAAGLADHGKPGSYFTRQIVRWTRQWEGSQTDGRTNPSIDKLAEWLPKNVPDGDDETVIVHGDFRFDNMMFHQTEPRVIGIFDWELSTLGHPMADLAYACIRHNMPSEAYDGLVGLDLAALGIPEQRELVDLYNARTGRSADITPFHVAFCLFRLAVILEGVLARARAGNASNSSAGSMGPVATLLADRAWELVG
ncbi:MULTISPECIES: phosphotransferase [Rhodomicrobium]|uniref:phosphotransferase n=1 Tax=Rhodomicrobium TaxID=1068 RepID=UPI001FD99F5D|nr:MULTISPECIES: phosphotransferase [Rhodomicrobium]